MSGEGGAHEEHFITTVDIIYGAITGSMITVWFNVFRKDLLAATLLVLFVFVLLTDDWYGAHFAATAHPYTFSISLLEIVGVPIFFFLLYTGSTQTVYFCLAMVAYGTRGFLWDYWYLRNIEVDSFERSTIYLWSYYALSIILVYLALFLYLWSGLGITTLSVGHTLALVGVWTLMRSTMEFVVRWRSKSPTERTHDDEVDDRQAELTDFK